MIQVKGGSPGGGALKRKKKNVWPRRENESAYDYKRRIADTAVARGNNLSSSPARKPHKGAAKMAQNVGNQKMRRLTAMSLLHKMVGSYDFVRSPREMPVKKRRVKSAKRLSMSAGGPVVRQARK